MDCYCDWAKVRGVGEDGIVLVRSPDHSVAWRCEKMVDNPLNRVSSVAESILGKNIKL